MITKTLLCLIATSLGLSSSLASGTDPGQAAIELRTKVLNAIRATKEIAEIQVTQSGSDRVEKYKFSVSDLKPDSLEMFEQESAKPVDLSDLSRIGVNADVLSYSFFNSEIPKPFGFDKKFHITYTPVVSKSGSLSHFLVYYDKENFYPLKVTYFNGSTKVTTVEYKQYKKIKNKVWRAHLITSENHLSQKKTQIEFTKIDINPDSKTPPRLGKKDPSPTL